MDFREPEELHGVGYKESIGKSEDLVLVDRINNVPPVQCARSFHDEKAEDNPFSSVANSSQVT